MANGSTTVGAPITPSIPEPSSQETQSACCSGPRNFCGNVLQNWRAFPALACLVTNIMGIVMSMLMGEPYIAIPFGVGAISSIYMVSLSSDFVNLASFGESNQVYKQNNDTYAELNKRMGRRLKSFGNENIKLKQQVVTLTETTRDQRTLLDRLQKTTEAQERQQKAATEANNILLSQLGEVLKTASQNQVVTERERGEMERLSKGLVSAHSEAGLAVEKAQTVVASLLALSTSLNTAFETRGRSELDAIAALRKEREAAEKDRAMRQAELAALSEERAKLSGSLEAVRLQLFEMAQEKAKELENKRKLDRSLTTTAARLDRGVIAFQALTLANLHMNQDSLGDGVLPSDGSGSTSSAEPPHTPPQPTHHRTLTFSAPSKVRITPVN